MSRRKRYFGIAAILLLAIIAILAVTKPSSPEGRYVCHRLFFRVRDFGDYYWECSGGKVYFVSREDSGDATSREESDTYFHTQEGWFFSSGYESNPVPINKVLNYG